MAEVRHRGTVLLIEDQDDVRQGMAQLLELHGFLVADARTAEDAWRLMTAAPDSFALVLLDLMLPGSLSGWDFRMRQLAEPSLGAVPTIIVSCEHAEDTLRALRPDGWLEKPFQFEALLQIVKRYVVSEGSALQAEASEEAAATGLAVNQG